MLLEANSFRKFIERSGSAGQLRLTFLWIWYVFFLCFVRVLHLRLLANGDRFGLRGRSRRAFTHSFHLLPMAPTALSSGVLFLRANRLVNQKRINIIHTLACAKLVSKQSPFIIYRLATSCRDCCSMA
jgi:hypothetical protein